MQKEFCLTYKNYLKPVEIKPMSTNVNAFSYSFFG